MDCRDTAAISDLELMVLDETAEPKALPLSLLEDITNNFSNDREIGRGGFAVVYKGVLQNGMVVAVKRLSNMYMDEKKFHGEVECLLKARHKNIVRFLGYCADTQGNMMRYNGKLVMADVRERLLCFEYVSKGSLRDYISDESCRLEWRKCCQIIKGICHGLYHLHENRIVHLDLKPENVLLDDNMVPKITDFGLSRCFEEKQTSQSITSKLYGTLGYIAPELYSGRKITIKSDIFSLGIIIIEILTGQKGYPDVEAVLASWCDRLEKPLEDTQLEQVRVCIEIGIECSEFNPAKRPVSIQNIIERLMEIETTDEVSSAVSSTVFTNLFVHPGLLFFSCVPNKLISSSMYLRNFTDEHFAFRLVETYAEETERCFAKLPLYGIVPPRSTHTLGLTLQEREEKSIHLVLESSTFKDAQMPTSCSKFRGDKFLEEIKEKGNMVQQVTVKAVATAQREIEITSELIPPKTKILFKNSPFTTLDCEDVNPTKQWIITGHIRGYVHIWNGHTQRKLDSFKVSTDKVVLVKIIVRKEWFVAGSGDGFIHVYNYETKRQQVPSFKAHAGKLTSLAVHPSKPYLLSWSSDEMKLWDWDKGWECTQTFKGKHSGYICQVMFNPKNTNSFVTASANHMLEVWDLDSPQCKNTLSGHWDRVNCLDFFTYDDQQYLITGSSDCSAKIWDMHNNMCMYTLHASMSPVMSVLFHPNLQFLITGLEDGSVHLWNSTNFRLERIINTPVSEPGWGLTWLFNKFFSTPNSEPVWGLACSTKSKGFVFGRGEMVAVVDIDNVNNQDQEPTHYSVPQLSADMGPGDTTTQMIQGDHGLLEVHPSELRFPFQPRKSTTCSLDLTNHTYERVAFRLMEKQSEANWEKQISFLSNLPMYGFIPSRSTYTLVVTIKEQPDPPEDANLDLRLQSSISGDKFIVPFKNETECVDLFKELKETGNAVHAATLKAVSYPQGEVKDEELHTMYHQIISATKKLDELGFGSGLQSIDAHPTETWIITCKFFGDVCIWDLVAQEKKEPLYSFQVKKKSGIQAIVKFLKFIARKQWFLAGTDEGFIHVVTYGTEIVQEITSFRASSSNVTSMAIHPTQPYVLSSAYDSPIKLWNWDKGWECTQTFEGEHSGTIRQIAFNPKDTNCFASASDDQTVKVWSLDSPKSNYTLFGHLAQVNCLDFFARGDQQYLISGSDDLTVRIWDLEKRACVYTISALMAPVLSILCLLDRPYLIIGLKDGTLHLFSSTNFRLERIIGFGCSKVRSVILMGSVRVVIVQEGAVSIMDIDNENPAGIISEVRANVVDAVKLDVASEAQLEAPHIFQEPKEDLPAAQHAVSVTGNMNSAEASDVSQQLNAHTGLEGTASEEKLSSEKLARGKCLSRPKAASPTALAMPATPADGAPAAMPTTTTSTSDVKQQPESKRELHMFKEIVAGENFTEAQATAGIILPGKTKKYWVDKNGNNCFMLFPRGMSINWAEKPYYWIWQPLEEGSDGGDDAGIEVAELKNVCWLEIVGKQDLSHLTPGVTYEVMFEAMLKRKSSGWHAPVDLRLKYPDGRVQERKESLQERYSEEPLQLRAGDVEAREGLDGELVVSLSEHGGHWKRGLVVKGIRITPEE